MITSLPANDTMPRRRGQNAYACTDGERIVCKRDVVEIGEEGLRAPKNGILLRSGKSPAAVISGTQVSKDMVKLICSGNARTYMLPDSVVTVGYGAFRNR